MPLRSDIFRIPAQNPRAAVPIACKLPALSQMDVEEERNHSQDNGQHSRPGLPVQQSPSGDEPTRSFSNRENSNCMDEQTNKRWNTLRSQLNETRYGEDRCN